MGGMPYGGMAPELDPPEEDVPPDDAPDDDAPDVPDDEVPDVPEELPEPPEDDVEDDDELDVSSLPPQAAIAVALANKIAARVATRPVGGARSSAGGRATSQNGHAVSLARTCLLQSGQGLRLATQTSVSDLFVGHSIFGLRTQGSGIGSTTSSNLP
jgi:hypothetical protein